MTFQQFKKIQKTLKLALEEVEKEAFKEGTDVASDEFQKLLLAYKERLLMEAGLTLEQYEILEAEFKKGKIISRTKEEVKSITKEVLSQIEPEIPAPQIINKIEKQTTIIKEKPQIIKTIKTIEKIDTAQLETLRQDLFKLQSDFGKQISHTELIDILPDQHHFEKHDLESHIDSDLRKYLHTLTSGRNADRLHTHKFPSARRSILIGGRSGGGDCNWARTALTSTLSPSTLNDNIDLGSGDFDTTGIITGINVTSGSNPGHTHTLDNITNPAGNKTFTMSNKLLAFRYTAPTPAGEFAGAFEIEATGGFTGNLLHIHQHTGTVGEVDLVSIEAEDADVTCLTLTHTQANAICFNVDDALTIDKEGDIETTGTITSGNITIFDASPILVLKDSTSAGEDARGIIEWRDINNIRLGYFGNSSENNDELLWKNLSSGGHIQIQTTGAGEFQIFTGDSDDYITFSTTADVPKMTFVGGLGLITNLADPTDDQDAATKKFVLDNAGGVSNHSGLSELDYASAGHSGFAPALGGDDNYVTDAEKSALHTQNTDTALGSQSEDLNMNTHKIVNVVDPIDDQDAATKKFVLDNAGGIATDVITYTLVDAEDNDSILTGVPLLTPEPPDPITDFLAEMDVPRNVIIRVASLFIAFGTITVTGIDADGAEIEEVFVINHGGELTHRGNKAFARVLEVDVVGGDETTQFSLGWGEKIGLPNFPFNAGTDVFKVNLNGIGYVPGDYTVNTTYGTVKMNGGLIAGQHHIYWFRPSE